MRRAQKSWTATPPISSAAASPLRRAAMADPNRPIIDQGRAAKATPTIMVPAAAEVTAPEITVPEIMIREIAAQVDTVLAIVVRMAPVLENAVTVRVIDRPAPPEIGLRTDLSGPDPVSLAPLAPTIRRRKCPWRQTRRNPMARPRKVLPTEAKKLRAILPKRVQAKCLKKGPAPLPEKLQVSRRR
jgi:hypothetical protein